MDTLLLMNLVYTPSLSNVLAEHCEDFVFPKNQVLIGADFDVGTGVFAK
jgi:hypothetical protein